MAQHRISTALAALPVMAMAQSFNLWPLLDPVSLATKLNVSQTCVSALNTTVECDPTTFRMAGQVDMYLWDGDNITTLCTQSCINSTTNWISGVYDACDSTDTIYIDTKLVPIDTVAIRYTDGLGLACLTDDQLNITYYGYEEPDGTTDNSTIPLNATSTDSSLPGEQTATANDTIPDTNITYEYNYNQPNYCFNESQLWTGIDMPDCDNDPDDPLCEDPSEGMRIANYYNNTFLCSPCFISVFWWRVNSPFLPDSNHSDYLIEQFQDIQDVCNITMFDSLIRQSPPGYAIGTPPNYTLPGENSTSSNVCTGQTLSSSGASCNALSQKYGVTTGDLQAASGNLDCTFSSPICVPKNCTLSVINSNTTCDGFAASLSTSTVNVTDDLFLSWNPNIKGLCDALTEGQYVCTGPPGGSYLLPAPILNSTNAAGQQRGGQGSGSNPNGPLGPQGPTTNSTAQAPTQPGINPNCTLFAYAAANDTCYQFSQDFDITLEQLTKWNPILGYPDGSNCTTEFWAGYDYCVQIPGSGGTTTSASSSQASGSPTSSLPYPTQSGITPSCNKYAEAVSGDYCYKFAQDNNITTAQLYAWNSILGPNGANCSTEFQAGYDYCVGVSSSTTTTTSSTSTKPTSSALPTQSGIASDCNKYAKAVSGDYCDKFAQDNDITTAELYDWNKILGPNGANCSTEFQAGYDYCVGVSGSASVTPAPTTASSTSTTPTTSSLPTQSGIASNCDKLVEAVSGDYCYKFAQDNDITTTELYEWNTILGPNGQNCSTEFQAGYGYCVAVN